MTIAKRWSNVGNCQGTKSKSTTLRKRRRRRSIKVECQDKMFLSAEVATVKKMYGRCL